MRGLFVLYDGACGFCVRCAAWLNSQAQLVPLRCLPANDPEVQEIFWGARRVGDDELVVVSSEGGVYRAGDAFLMALWALRDYRGWARRLARPALRPFARGLFELVSSQRKSISGLMGFAVESDATLARHLEQRYGAPDVPKCAGGAACSTH
jgi:predicted DCC family thiol-disulfide oxidoreductase YuxK